MQLQKIKAFTLVELIVVIVILSILSTIGFMSFQSYTADARDSNRITSLKTIQSSLNIYKTKNQTLPFPDNYVDITGVSYQGNIGTGIINKLKLSGTFKDPKDSNYYTYSVSKNLSKFQISSLLENNNKIIFSFDDNLLNQVYADNTSRYTYTLGDRIGILLDSTTNTPVNELLNGTGTLNLNTDNNTYKAVFTNDSTNSGTISGTGTDLLTQISIIQSSCVLGNSVILSGQQISAYNTNSVAYNQTCTPIIRSCNNGVLDGDANYKYDTCSPVAALNCSPTKYNGYTIHSINHNANQNITKNITGGVADINASCVNGVLTYGTENINCSTNYVLDGGICQADLCTGNAPDFSISNGTQKYNNPWLHNTTSGICTYICQAGYYYNTNLCNAASIGNYVGTSGLTNQTACSANDKYQDTTGQTSCKNVSAGYYSTPIGNVAHTGQTQCEANNYCIGGVKTACPAGYSSPAGSSSARACVINQYTVTGTITNGNGATVNICGKTTTADTSGNFSVTVNYGTNCNNLSITRTNYTCSVSTNGSSSITSNSAVAGTCNANSQTYTCTGLPSNAVWNTVSSYVQTRNGSAWIPVNSTATYNTTSSTTSCNYKCNTGYINVSNICTKIGSTNTAPGLSCKDILDKGVSNGDGIYWIKPDSNRAFQVYCDMTTDGGGWTLVAISKPGYYGWENELGNGIIPTPSTNKANISSSIIDSIAPNGNSWIRLKSLTDSYKIGIKKLWNWEYTRSRTNWGTRTYTYACNTSDLTTIYTVVKSYWNNWCSDQQASWIEITGKENVGACRASQGLCSGKGDIALNWRSVSYNTYLTGNGGPIASNSNSYSHNGGVEARVK